MQGKGSGLAKMTHKYFLRKLEYFSRGPDTSTPSFHNQKKSFISNFQEHFGYYSKDRKLVDSFMNWLATANAKNKTPWEIYGKFVFDNSATYSIKNLIHISELLERHEKIPEGFPKLMEERLMQDLGSLSTKEIAQSCKQTKSEALLRKVKDEGRIIINNEYDLFFFSSAYLSRVNEFPDVIETLQSQLERILPTIRTPQSLCKILKLYSAHSVVLRPSIFRSIESTILSEDVEFRPLDISEILLTFQSAAYHARVSDSFWERFEVKVIAQVDNYSGSWLLGTVARNNFFSEPIFSAAVPLWMQETEREERADVFREGLCALMRFPGIEESTREWIARQLVLLGNKMSAFDVSTILRAIVVPGWYEEHIWKILLDRFFSSDIGKVRDIDKSMVYFAVKSLEIDEARIRNLVTKSRLAALKEAFEKTRFAAKSNKMHVVVAEALKALEVPFTEHEPLIELYTADFAIQHSNIAIICYEWPQHLCAGSKEVTPGVQMMLRHLNKSGWKVIIAASTNDLPARLQTILRSAKTQPTARTFHIV